MQANGGLLEPPEGAYLSEEGLDAWARDTNGAPFDEDTKEELLEFMDVTDDGGLTSVWEHFLSRLAHPSQYYPPDLRGSCKSISYKPRTTRKRPGETS